MILVGVILSPDVRQKTLAARMRKGKNLEMDMVHCGKNEIASLKVQAVVWVMNVVTGTTREPFH